MYGFKYDRTSLDNDWRSISSLAGLETLTFKSDIFVVGHIEWSIDNIWNLSIVS